MTDATLLTVQQAAEMMLRAEALNDKRPFMRRGFVYIIRGQITRRIKIGFSQRFEGRLAALQSANADDLELMCLFAATKALELHLHKRYEKHRLHGEWFNNAPAIVRLCRDTYSIGQHETLPGIGWRE